MCNISYRYNLHGMLYFRVKFVRTGRTVLYDYMLPYLFRYEEHIAFFNTVIVIEDLVSVITNLITKHLVLYHYLKKSYVHSDIIVT